DAAEPERRRVPRLLQLGSPPRRADRTDSRRIVHARFPDSRLGRPRADPLPAHALRRRLERCHRLRERGQRRPRPCHRLLARRDRRADEGGNVSTIPVEPTSTAGIGSVWRRLARLQARFPILQVILLIAVYSYGAASLPGLSSWAGVSDILWFASFAGLAATGQTLLILMGGFDLSVSSFIVSSALVVSVLKYTWGVSFEIAILIAVVVGALLGGLAGQICHRFEIQPLIVTLAMGGIAIGLVQVQTGGSFAGSSP